MLDIGLDARKGKFRLQQREEEEDSAYANEVGGVSIGKQREKERESNVIDAGSQVKAEGIQRNLVGDTPPTFSINNCDSGAFAVLFV